MNKNIQSLLLLCVTAVIFGSCQKDEPASLVTLRATIADTYTTGGNGAKVTIEALQPSFDDGDLLWVNNTENVEVSVSAGVATMTADEAANYSAVFPSDIVTASDGGTFPVTVTLPDHQTYTHNEVDGKYIQKINAPIAAYATDQNLNFKNVCALLRVRVRNNMGMGTFHLDSIRVTTATNNIAGTATISESAGEFSMAVTSGGKSVTLTGLNEEVLENKSSREYYVYIPPVAGETFTITAYGIFDGDLSIAELYQESTSGAGILKNNIGTAPLRLSDCDAVYIKAFSVAADKKVYFSKGNLQWSYNNNATHNVAGGGTASGTWRFAEHQWEAFNKFTSDTYSNYVTHANAATDNHWMDLFGWGTSGWDNGNTYYKPSDKKNTNTYSNGYGYGPTNGSSYNFSLTGTYANADWGVYNEIQNGDITDPVGTWRTLTRTEWDYLLNSRASASSLRTAATVCGKKGYVFLPDSWVAPDDVSITMGTNSTGTNTLTAEQWTKLENNGAIFLPITGYRAGVTTDAGAITISDTLHCKYWTSTYGINLRCAYCFRFTSGSAPVIESGSSNPYTEKYRGYAVRLVRDAN